MKNIKIVFMGTPDFACSVLETLKEEGLNIVAVVSQPDKKVGRKQELQNTPVKKLALEYGIDVIQPINIKEEYMEVLKYEPDLIITCAYGQFIPEQLLNYPKYSCINVHASLLPKYRGGAPIHRAIINGDKISGITIVKMIKKMDAGEMYLQEIVEIEKDDTTEILHDKLKIASKIALKKFLSEYFKGNLKSIKQNEDEVVYARNIEREEEFISFNDNVEKIYNKIRGLISWPVGYGTINGKNIKFHQVSMEVKKHNYSNGEVIGFNSGMEIACEGGIIKVLKLQLEGKSKISYIDFKNGKGKDIIGSCFK